MNLGNRFMFVVIMFCVGTTLAESNSINYGKVNPPWRPGKYYSVISRYDMELRNIVMDVKILCTNRQWYAFWKPNQCSQSFS